MRYADRVTTTAGWTWILIDMLEALVVMSYVLSVRVCIYWVLFVFFFFNDTATTEIYTLSLHDALPILMNTFCV